MIKYMHWIKIFFVYFAGVLAGSGFLAILFAVYVNSLPVATPPTSEQIYLKKRDAFNNLNMTEQQQVKLLYDYAQKYSMEKDPKFTMEMLGYLHEILPGGYKSSQLIADYFKLKGQIEVERVLNVQNPTGL